MDAETRFFLAELQHLAQLATDPRTTAPIAASGVLRRLLLDNPAILHQVNSNHHLKISFSICEAGDAPPVASLAWFVADQLDPHTFPAPANQLSLKGFLSSTVGSVGERPFTVKDVILHAAHVRGGVHRYPPKKEQERAIAELESQLPSLVQLSLDSTVRALSRIVLRALAPLRDATLDMRRFSGVAGATLLMYMRVLELGDDADIHIFHFGRTPSIRITVSPHGQLRLHLRDDHRRRLTVDGPYISIGEGCWITAQLGVARHDVALRVRINSVEVAAVFPDAARHTRWADVMAAPLYTRIGESPTGVFDMGTHFAYSKFLTEENAERMHGWCRVQPAPKKLLRFAPGQGLKTSVPEGIDPK